MSRNICKLACLGAVVAVGLTMSSQIARAQNLPSLSCGQLWYERNAIFAQFGHCFRTEQGIQAFGRGCFPPYGRLLPAAQARVNAIVGWERRKGCAG